MSYSFQTMKKKSKKLWKHRVIKIAHLLLQNGREHDPHWIITRWEPAGRTVRFVWRRIKPSAQTSKPIPPNLHWSGIKTTCTVSVTTSRGRENKQTRKDERNTRKCNQRQTPGTLPLTFLYLAGKKRDCCVFMFFTFLFLAVKGHTSPMPLMSHLQKKKPVSVKPSLHLNGWCKLFFFLVTGLRTFTFQFFRYKRFVPPEIYSNL